MNRRLDAVAVLQANIGYVFKDLALIERALTHASAVQGRGAVADNERLEFLGDRVLGLIVAEELIRRDPDASPDGLTRRLHSLVDRSACARVAASIGLAEALRVQGGAGLRTNDTALGDACEALVAALFVEGGYELARGVVLGVWADELDRAIDLQAYNPKTTLQEWAMSLGLNLPRYAVVSRSGPAHAPLFVIQVEVEGFAPASAEGRSRQEAEKAAAQALLQRERPQ